MHARLERVCARHGVAQGAGGAGREHAEHAEHEERTALAVYMDAATRDVSLFGEHAGERTEKRRVAARAEERRSERGGGASAVLVGEHGGVNVHAGVVVDGRDRAALERVCRYVTRPPIALERLRERAEGGVEVSLRRAWRDGTRAVVMTEEDLVARLCGIVPPPRFHLTRYAGVLAPHAKLRAEVVPGRRGAGSHAGAASPRVQGELFGEKRDEAGHAGDGRAHAKGEEDEEGATSIRATRHPWAWLLRRVFAVEVLVCVHYAGKIRLVEIATEPEATRRIAREERRRRGEAVGPMGTMGAASIEARGPPRGAPGQQVFAFR
jgi:hypothetical protein